MKINYNVTGEKRKELVKVIAETTGAKAVYKGMPTAAYEIDFFTVTKDGALEFSDMSDSEIVEGVLDAIANAGFDGVGENAEQPEETEPANDDEQPEQSNEQPEAEEEEEVLSISLPDDLTDAEFSRLKALLAAKATILKHAFKSDGITVERKDWKITFDGFPAIDGDHTKACMDFVTLLTEFAKNAQRIVSTDHEVENEKYYFRIFLMRLGMNGPEHKQTRKILLENLSGNAAFKTDAQLKAHTEKWKEKRAAEKEAEAEEEQEGEENEDAE